MRNIHIRPRAQADIDEIWNYTAAEWDEDQAEIYIHAMRAALRRAAVHPMIGSDASHLAADLRRGRSGSHMIYYFHGPTLIDVVRVLHERMDAEGQLPDA